MKLRSPNPIRSVREAAGLSQVELSLLARVCLSTLRNAEQGIATRRTLRLLARALKLSSVDQLSGRRAP